jgi:hypothetical protein
MEPMQAFGDGCEVERSAGTLRFDALEVLSPSGCEAVRIPGGHRLDTAVQVLSLATCELLGDDACRHISVAAPKLRELNLEVRPGVSAG